MAQPNLAMVLFSVTEGHLLTSSCYPKFSILWAIKWHYYCSYMLTAQKCTAARKGLDNIVRIHQTTWLKFCSASPEPETAVLISTPYVPPVNTGDKKRGRGNPCGKQWLKRSSFAGRWSWTELPKGMWLLPHNRADVWQLQYHTSALITWMTVFNPPQK